MKHFILAAVLLVSACAGHDPDHAIIPGFVGEGFEPSGLVESDMGLASGLSEGELN